jgi:hypothetical protein
MKTFILWLFLYSIGLLLPAWGQQQEASDTLRTHNVLRTECPDLLLSALTNDSLQHKAALFFINDSSHPLGKSEFMDNRKAVKYLKTSIRMNRITLLYIPPGMHRFQTLYMKKFEEVNFAPGEIYIAALITTSIWPVPYSFIKEDRLGREYVPVLFLYLTGEEAESMIEKIKNKEIILNKKQ